MHPSRYRQLKKTVASILSKCNAGLVSAEQAALEILEAIAPSLSRAIGMEHYFDCACGWLKQVLSSEPRMTVTLLAERIQALTAISPGMRAALGGIHGRLRLLSQI